MYMFTYRRRAWLPKKSLLVEAHSYNAAQDKMWLQTATGSIEVSRWSRCESFLGPDWKAHVEALERAQLERQSKAE